MQEKTNFFHTQYILKNNKDIFDAQRKMLKMTVINFFRENFCFLFFFWGNLIVNIRAKVKQSEKPAFCFCVEKHYVSSSDENVSMIG
jgi:hypothetical protein